MRKKGVKPKDALVEPKKDIKELTKDADAILEKTRKKRGEDSFNNTLEVFEDLLDKSIEQAIKKEKE